MEDNANQEGQEAKPFNPQEFLENDISVQTADNEFTPPVINQGGDNGSQGGDDGNGNEGGDGSQGGDDGGDEKKYSFDDDFSVSEQLTQAPAEFKVEDHAQMAKSLNVKIDTQEDLDAVMVKFKTDDSQQQQDNQPLADLSQEESTKIDGYNKALESAKSVTDKELMKWHLRTLDKAKYEGEDGESELDYQIDTLEETGLLLSQSKAVRENLVRELETNIDTISKGAQDREVASTASMNKELETELKSYKDGFHGVNIPAKDVIDTYHKVRNGSIFEEIESSQANVAEFSLLWANRKLFYNAMENPSNSPGTQNFMDNLQNSKPKPASGVDTLRTTGKDFDPNAFLADDLKTVSSQEGQG